MKTKFDEKIISRNGPVYWPLRFCDLAPLAYFQWGYINSKVYADKPATVNALEPYSVRASATRMVRKVTHNWTSTIRFVKNNRGGYMFEIILKC